MGKVTWQGILLLLGLFAIGVRIGAFHFVPWPYFLAPVGIWLATVSIRGWYNSRIVGGVARIIHDADVRRK